MLRTISFFLVLVTVACTPAQTIDRSRPSVLILGDSQISFGAGAAYLDFFSNLAQKCSVTALNRPELQKLGQASTLAVGVRSSSLHSWVAQNGVAKDTICKIDETYGVNAGVYGIGGQPSRKYIQIGQEPGFQYCQRDKSAFESIFSVSRNDPDLLILNFLGNAQQRWATSQAAVDADVEQTLQQIPKSVPCVIVTTAPVFSKASNDQRVIAQARLARAVERRGNQCHVVQGITPQTRNAIEAEPRYFRQNADGKVIDPLHPNTAAAHVFLDLIGSNLCDAIALALK